jgi:hypothetical protein
MACRHAIGAIALVASLGAAIGCGVAAEHPDWKGQWVRKAAGTFDPNKPFGLGQQAPLTPEYQKVLEQSVADQAAGGQGNNPMAACIPPGMPRMMIGYGGGFEFIITPEITYAIQGEPMLQLRRIHTDGRAWPKEIEPSFSGYSIGKWEDTDGDGKYDTLVVETRALKSPRSYDSSGLPFHKNGQTVVHERIYLDKANPEILRDDITVHDDALTRPWSVSRVYHRDRKPYWLETICGEDEHQVKIGKEQYFLSGDGHLMPTRKDQAPPDLRYFNQGQR